MTWWMWSIVANFMIVLVEAVNRTATVGPLETLPKTFLPIALMQIALFYAWQGAPSLMMAWAFLTVGSAVLRVLTVRFVVGEPVGLLVVAGVMVMIAGGRLISMGLAR